MNKMNKKGFTLIEMLVVIAIIAVLVAIIVPTVTSSTDKAAAATDAANLRSAKATVTIGLLDGTYKSGDAPTAAELGIPEKSKLGQEQFSCTINGQEVTVKYGDHKIEWFQVKAGGTNSNGGTELPT